MYQKISVKRLGKPWIIFNYAFLAVWTLMTCIFLFVGNINVHSFMLFYVSPVAMVVFLIYFTTIILLNVQKSKTDKTSY